MRKYVAADGKSTLVIVQTASGFRFIEEAEMYSPPGDSGEDYDVGYTYWAERHHSGLYDNFSAALADAQAVCAWIRDVEPVDEV